MKKQKLQFLPEYLDDWPKHFYELQDASLREQCLKEYSLQHPDSPEEIRREEIFIQRYGNGVRHQDKYYYAWSMLKSMSESATFLNRKKREIELRQYMIDFAILSEKTDDLQILEWQNFANQFIKDSMQGQSYGSTLLGLGRISTHDKISRIAHDIQTVTVSLPREIYLDKQAQPLHNALEKALLESNEEAKEIIDRIHRAAGTK